MGKLVVERIDGSSKYDFSVLSSKNAECIFIDRKKDAAVLLIVIAGYKSFLYEDVFARLKKFAPENIDVCIVSSGILDEKLERIARENEWSYLSTKRNCVTLVQNIAIGIHAKAEFIYKMDEDIFVTRNNFQVMWDTLMKVEQKDDYNVGFVAPLMPINGYGHVRILEKLGMVGVYEKMFEKVKYAPVMNRMIGSSGEAARFLWGENGFIPSIDYMDEEFSRQDFQYRACPVRYSIGFILMRRQIWEIMGGWPVPEEGSGMGLDEDKINQFCIMYSFGMIVSENKVAGHLAFGGQTESMKEYYGTHRSVFCCP